MPFEIEAICPCCQKEARGDLNKIQEIFGFRKVSDGRLIPQSYCRVCRGLRCSPGDKRCSS
ncbi:hypothetical protein BV920_07260 [Pectobacterium odoriferum]|nr:hypothetical protein BV920_07260 [Pectobacterium odoriferum]